MKSCRVLPALSSGTVLPLACTSGLKGTAVLRARWWKGNTHTLWSDGNAAPEKVAHLAV